MAGAAPMSRASPALVCLRTIYSRSVQSPGAANYENSTTRCVTCRGERAIAECNSADRVRMAVFLYPAHIVFLELVIDPRLDRVEAESSGRGMSPRSAIAGGALSRKCWRSWRSALRAGDRVLDIGWAIGDG